MNRRFYVVNVLADSEERNLKSFDYEFTMYGEKNNSVLYIDIRNGF